MPSLPIFDKGFTQEEIEFGFNKFVEGLQEMTAEHCATQFPNLTPNEVRVDVGRVYWKVVKHTPGKKWAPVFIALFARQTERSSRLQAGKLLR